MSFFGNTHPTATLPRTQPRLCFHVGNSSPDHLPFPAGRPPSHIRPDNMRTSAPKAAVADGDKGRPLLQLRGHLDYIRKSIHLFLLNNPHSTRPTFSLKRFRKPVPGFNRRAGWPLSMENSREGSICPRCLGLPQN